MLTYTLDKQAGLSLYEQLYRRVKADILSGRLAAGEKLPSKRALAAHLEVSVITVKNAYEQLMAEGYLTGVEKKGYFVSAVLPSPAAVPASPEQPPPPREPVWFLDLATNSIAAEDFPFTVWARLMRQTILEQGTGLLRSTPPQGAWALRQAIAAHLRQFRAMEVTAEQIIVGAGTEVLYNLLVQLLGRDRLYGVEDPGYGKIAHIYRAAGAEVTALPLDEAGVSVEALRRSDADVVHISPSHHYPTGLVNTFSKTIAPSIRISFMVLPRRLLADFRQKLGFYACTVSAFEQYTLAQFLAGGWYEKHLSRMRKHYRQKRDAVIAAVYKSPLAPYAAITEEDAGLHFLLRLDGAPSDETLRREAEQRGIRLAMLSDYYQCPQDAPQHVLVVNYTGIDLDRLPAALERLAALWKENDHV